MQHQKRPEGISRELFGLIGEQLPAVAPASPLYRDKPNFTKRATSWSLCPFINAARRDNLQLKHWEKTNDPQTEYPFAKFGYPVEVVQYSEEEYQAHLQDPDWTAEETDYLMHLCKEYDLRFIVIADRFSYRGKQRSLEDIKDRYYAVTKKLLFERNPLADPKKKADISALNYDKAKDLERKTFIQRLYQRSWEEIKEEESLLIEARRIDAHRKRMEKDRENLIRLMNSDLFALPNLSHILSGDSACSPSGFESKMKKKSRKRMEQIMETAPPTTPLIAKKEKKVSGVYVRSQLLTAIKSQTMQQKAKQVLDELGIGLTPKMPTSEICEQFDLLIQSILALLEMKRQIDKLEHELHILQNRKAALMSDHSAQTPVAAVDAYDIADDEGSSKFSTNVKKRPSSPSMRLTDSSKRIRKN